MLQLQVECYRDEAERLSELLEEQGALSITLTDKHDDPILEPELGTTPLWPHVIIHALFADKSDAEQAFKILAAQNMLTNASLLAVPEKDWELVCKNDFKPIQFGKRLWICPSWSTPPEPDAVNLILDPGLAFGTGSHPTTSLCLSWLEQAALKDKVMIDYGCGSGILSLAAVKLGAQHVYAVDIDKQALIATLNNAKINDIGDQELTVNFPDELRSPADLIIANILLTPLLQLKDRFHQLLKNEGKLVVSGLLQEQTTTLVEAYQGLFSQHTSVIQDGWALLVFTKT